MIPISYLFLKNCALSKHMLKRKFENSLRGEIELYGPKWSKAIRSKRFLEVIKNKNLQASEGNTGHDLDKLLTPTQPGYRERWSCVTTLVDVAEELQLSVAESRKRSIGSDLNIHTPDCKQQTLEPTDIITLCQDFELPNLCLIVNDDKR
ncbi:hypothetical protein GQX74_009746 [Glossina fuscipes]|nr:hypothetical protein GQX74_009746 [Glossina fuscipes]